MAAPRARVRQADIERAVRALKATGCEHVRIVVTSDGVVVEPMQAPVEPVGADNWRGQREPERVIVV